MRNQKCLILSETYYFWGEGGYLLRAIDWKVISCVKSEVLELESNLLFPGGGGVIYNTQL